MACCDLTDYTVWYFLFHLTVPRQLVVFVLTDDLFIDPMDNFVCCLC